MTARKNIHCPQGHQTATAANSRRRKGHEGAVEEDPVGISADDCGLGHPDHGVRLPQVKALAGIGLSVALIGAFVFANAAIFVRYNDRCKALKESTPEGEWDGVFTMTKK